MEATRIYAPRGSSQCSVERCEGPYYGSGFCKKHHQWHWVRGLLPRQKRIDLLDKLKANSEVDSNGCWLWQGHLNNKGYGVVNLPSGKKQYAHRASYRMFVGPIGRYLLVCHECDVPACINPDHLFLGTHYQNMQDASRKGRLKPPPMRYGVDHRNAVLTEDQVRRIVVDARPATMIARELSVHAETVRRARRRETYRNVRCGSE